MSQSVRLRSWLEHILLYTIRPRMRSIWLHLGKAVGCMPKVGHCDPKNPITIAASSSGERWISQQRFAWFTKRFLDLINHSSYCSLANTMGQLSSRSSNGSTSQICPFHLLDCFGIDSTEGSIVHLITFYNGSQVSQQGFDLAETLPKELYVIHIS